MWLCQRSCVAATAPPCVQLLSAASAKPLHTLSCPPPGPLLRGGCRPRPLMDVTPHQAAEAAEGSEAGGEGEDGGASAATAAPSKPLEQEPLLAARIMIEDCMALLLDVEDIDRIFVAAAGGALRACLLRRAVGRGCAQCCVALVRPGTFSLRACRAAPGAGGAARPRH